MKAKKVIWYGETPPKDSEGRPIKNAIFDKRIKKIAIGEDVSGLVKDKGVEKRMEDDGIIAKEIDPILASRAAEDKKAEDERKVKKISEGEGKAAK